MTEWKRVVPTKCATYQVWVMTAKHGLSHLEGTTPDREEALELAETLVEEDNYVYVLFWATDDEPTEIVWDSIDGAEARLETKGYLRALLRRPR